MTQTEQQQDQNEEKNKEWYLKVPILNNTKVWNNACLVTKSNEIYKISQKNKKKEEELKKKLIEGIQKMEAIFVLPYTKQELEQMTIPELIEEIEYYIEEGKREVGEI